jgi:predicted molibdopterin-dependent oxidoreductase YjgC
MKQWQRSSPNTRRKCFRNNLGTAEDIRKAARIYAEAEAAAICYSMGLTQHSTGTDNVKSVCNLAMLTGNIGRPGPASALCVVRIMCRFCDMGALPVVYPAYQAVTNEANVKNWKMPGA